MKSFIAFGLALQALALPLIEHQICNSHCSADNQTCCSLLSDDSSLLEVRAVPPSTHPTVPNPHPNTPDTHPSTPNAPNTFTETSPLLPDSNPPPAGPAGPAPNTHTENSPLFPDTNTPPAGPVTPHGPGAVQPPRALSGHEQELLADARFAAASMPNGKGELSYLQASRAKVDATRRGYTDSNGKRLKADADWHQTEVKFASGYDWKVERNGEQAVQALNRLGDKISPFVNLAITSKGDTRPVMSVYAPQDGSRMVATWRYKEEDRNDVANQLTSSELTFALYRFIIPDPKKLQQFYAAQITNDATRYAMMLSNQKMGIPFDQAVTVSRSDTGVKGETFTLLAGTDNAKPVGYMLADHQEAFGGKIIDSITYRIMTDQDREDSPVMRFDLKPEY